MEPTGLLIGAYVCAAVLIILYLWPTVPRD